MTASNPTVLHETADDEDTGPDSAPADTDTRTGEQPVTAGRLATVRAHLGARWRSVAVVVLLVVSLSLAVLLYLTQYRPDQLTGPPARDAAVDAASTGTEALLSYAPDTLDEDLATARSLMTGEFLDYYGRFTADVVAPAVREKGITATAQVLRAGVIEIHPRSAKVLVFLNQETISGERPDPSRTASSVIVSLTDVDGDWLISSFDPI